MAWKRCKISDIHPGQKRSGPHKFNRFLPRGCGPWPYCAQCGLLRLKNDVTRRAAKKQCEWEVD